MMRTNISNEQKVIFEKLSCQIGKNHTPKTETYFHWPVASKILPLAISQPFVKNSQENLDKKRFTEIFCVLPNRRDFGQNCLTFSSQFQCNIIIFNFFFIYEDVGLL